MEEEKGKAKAMSIPLAYFDDLRKHGATEEYIEKEKESLRKQGVKVEDPNQPQTIALLKAPKDLIMKLKKKVKT